MTTPQDPRSKFTSKKFLKSFVSGAPSIFQQLNKVLNDIRGISRNSRKINDRTFRKS